MKKIITLLFALMFCVVGGAAMTGCGGQSASKVKMINIKLSSEEYGVAVKSGDADLLNTVNQVLATNKDAIDTLIETYENKEYQDDTPVDNTVTEGVVTYTDGMDKNQYLVMATDAPFAPWEYTVGNNYGGIDVEIGKMIATALGKTLAIKQTAFDTICMTVNQGGADIGLAGLTITPARQKVVTFSTPYYTGAYQVLVVKADDTTFDNCQTTDDVVAILKTLKNGTKVGSQTGTTGAKYISGDEGTEDGFGFPGFKNLSLKSYDTHALAVRDLSNGSLSLCVVDNLVAAQVVAQINATIK